MRPPSTPQLVSRLERRGNQLRSVRPSPSRIDRGSTDPGGDRRDHEQDEGDDKRNDHVPKMRPFCSRASSLLRLHSTTLPNLLPVRLTRGVSAGKSYQPRWHTYKPHARGVTYSPEWRRGAFAD